MVFLVVKAAVTLLREKTAAMPLVKGFPFPVSTQQSERHGRVKRMHMDSVQQWLNVHPPISGLRGGMVVAVVYENRDAKLDGAAASQYAILNVCCVFALAHPDSFFEECIAERKLPDWDRTFEPETLDVHVSARLDSTAHPTIRRERVRDVIVLDGLLSLGNELSAADRRIERSDQQSVSHSSPSMDHLAPPGLFRLASAGDFQRKSLEPGSRGEIESFAICFTPREVVPMLRPKDGAQVLACGRENPQPPSPEA